MGASPVDVEALMTVAEANLWDQFNMTAEEFRTRNELLRQNAAQSVRSFSERKLGWLKRQLSRSDLNARLRNMYQGWSERLERETQDKLDDIERKSAVRSALQVIGVLEIAGAGFDPSR